MLEYLFLIVTMLVLGEITAYSCTGKHLFFDWRIPKKKRKGPSAEEKRAAYCKSSLSRVYPLSQVTPRKEEEE